MHHIAKNPTPPAPNTISNLSLIFWDFSMLYYFQVLFLDHLSPYWFSLPLCIPDYFPDIIIKMETIGTPFIDKIVILLTQFLWWIALMDWYHWVLEQTFLVTILPDMYCQILPRKLEMPISSKLPLYFFFCFRKSRSFKLPIKTKVNYHINLFVFGSGEKPNGRDIIFEKQGCQLS